MFYYTDREREHYPEQLIQGEGVVTEDISEHATLEPDKADTTNSNPIPNVGKRLKQIARDEGRAGNSPFFF